MLGLAKALDRATDRPVEKMHTRLPIKVKTPAGKALIGDRGKWNER